MWVYLLGPLVLTIATALATTRRFDEHATPTPGRISLAVLGLELGAAALTIAVVSILIATPVTTRCQPGTTVLDVVVGLSGWIVAMIGGVALGAMRADARRHGGTLVWHPPAGVVVFVLPYFVFVAVVFLGLSCSS